MSCPSDRGVGIVVCDVRIEDVNVAHGLRVGDELLSALAERLGGLAEGTGTAARLGAGTLVLVVPDVPADGTGAGVLASAVERVTARLTEPVVTRHGPVHAVVRVAGHVARPARHDADREPVEVLDAVLRRLAPAPPR